MRCEEAGVSWGRVEEERVGAVVTCFTRSVTRSMSTRVPFVPVNPSLSITR